MADAKDLVDGSRREDRQCALWVFRHHSLYVELCDNESEAVFDAVAISDGGSGSVAGVQFDDGEFIAREAWPALEAEQKRQLDAFYADYETHKNDPPPPVREIRAPFGDGRHTTKVRPDAPAWLGAHAPVSAS